MRQNSSKLKNLKAMCLESLKNGMSYKQYPDNVTQ